MSNTPNNLLITNLVEFGLSDKEAKVYISLLEFEIATVQQIAKASGINRSSTYVVLDSLKQKGLVSFSDDKNVQQYIPSSPNTLLKTAEELAQKQEQIKKNIDSIVPDLKALYKGIKEKPVVRVFQGSDGLVNLLEDSYTSKEKYLRTVTAAKNLKGIVSINNFEKYFKKRIENKIRIKGIHPENEFTADVQPYHQKTNDERIFVPENMFDFKSNLGIYDNKVTFLSPNNGGVGILIESKEISDVMKSIFDLAYSGLQLNNPKKKV